MFGRGRDTDRRVLPQGKVEKTPASVTTAKGMNRAAKAAQRGGSAVTTRGKGAR